MYYKTLKVPVKCSKADYKYLLQCSKESAKVWNFILDTEKKFREENDGKWITRNQLQTATKGVSALHARGIQQVVIKYIDAREGSVKAKEVNGNNSKYPHRKKKYFVTIWDYQALRIKDSCILLTKPVIISNGKRKLQKPVKCHVKSIPSNIVQIELLFKDKLYLSIKYKEPATKTHETCDNHASIDLGEIHAITSIDSRGNAVIITGRKVRAIKQLRNKQQAELRSKISKTKNGSKQNRKYRNSLRRLRYKSERQILDATHKISSHFVEYCLNNKISTVYYGDLDSATRNTKSKLSSKTTQKLSQWNYGELVDMLTIKLSRLGIRMVKVNEYYTSQTCPSCSERHKPTGRDYICKCGYKQHRDIVGAVNILNQNAGTKIKYYKEKKYLRIA